MGRSLQQTRYSRLVKAIGLSESVVDLLSDPSKRQVHGSLECDRPLIWTVLQHHFLCCARFQIHRKPTTRVLFLFSQTILVMSATTLGTLSDGSRNSRRNLTLAIRTSVKKRWQTLFRRSLHNISFQGHTKLQTSFRILHMPPT